jgi:regulatory protein
MAVTMMSRLFYLMATITALKTQKRNAERINVFLDGQFAFGLAAAATAGLRTGQILSEQEISDLQRKDDFENARQRAIHLISLRPRSAEEVRRNLQRKSFDDLLIDQVVDHLIAVNLLNDAAFAAYWVEQRETFRPRSRLALRQELHQKGVQRTVIDTALEQVDEMSAARQAAEKRARRWTLLSEDEYRVKLGRFLQRRGFPYDVIVDTTNATWQALNEE